jgi:hypothetical protein
MRTHLHRLLTVSTVVVAAFGAGLVTEDYLSPTAATIALALVLFASTLTAWIRPAQ